MPPARTPRRHVAALSASAAGILLAGAALAAPALAEPPQGHPHGQPPGQGDLQPPAAPPEHAAAAATSPDEPTPDAANADRPAAQPAEPGQGSGQGEDAPGNAGTVKVHEVGTADDDRRNEPKFCDLRIVGFGFPADADLAVTILGHGGPNAGPSTFETEVTTDQLSATGDWAIPGPSLEDGMYKLEVENTTAPGGPKQKVFKVDCPDDTSVLDEDVDVDVDEGIDVDKDVDVDVDADEVGGSETPGTQVLGTYLERDLPAVDAAAQVGTASTGGASSLPRTGVELLTLVSGAAALVAGGTLLQRRARPTR